MRWISLIALAIWTILAITACSATYHCKHCLDSGHLKTDSTSQTIEFKTPEVKADTTISNPPAYVINWDSLRNANPDEFTADTVRINKDRLHIKLVPGKTIFVEGKCDPVIKDSVVTKTIINTVEVGINKARHVLELIGVGLLALVVGAGLMRLFR